MECDLLILFGITLKCRHLKYNIFNVDLCHLSRTAGDSDTTECERGFLCVIMYSGVTSHLKGATTGIKKIGTNTSVTRKKSHPPLRNVMSNII